MGARLRSWWQQVKQHLATILVVAIILIVAIALIIVGYRFDWTGFNGNIKSGKTLWDWMQLLIIPAVLAIGGYVFTFTTSRNERAAAEKHAEAEREIASDNQREAALQAYLDNISELLLHDNLRSSKTNDEVRNIARIRTLTVLPRLDPKRKGSVILFLTESGLISSDDAIIDLLRADLNGVQLYKPWLNEVNLHKTDLSEADLYEADLLGANLSGADLSEAHLAGAILYSVNLSNANLLRTDLHDAELGDADLRNANLSDADLQRARLTNADLSKATMRAANLSGADLSKANLQGAILFGANLHRANLADADLSETNLYRANISSEQMEKAKSLKGTTMPDGSAHP
ncbi:pentapeptide repeat-containing protein [Ktedonobacter racemifer]|uniref:Pentapeptide repeat protein n=1 Tax=Ktedonobacter racemifer DSM 44963 TaxID=485913 RepID=D6U360_KTERA|nr:pentapeptide repeat-containing protein [Ktedonobacter racemifer]EFH81064.1 pentapeptide repeat protein [Ktedonobacter racemifer DSM 44963]